jgi:hypothetical protein
MKPSISRKKLPFLPPSLSARRHRRQSLPVQGHRRQESHRRSSGRTRPFSDKAVSCDPSHITKRCPRDSPFCPAGALAAVGARHRSLNCQVVFTDRRIPNKPFCSLKLQQGPEKQFPGNVLSQAPMPTLPASGIDPLADRSAPQDPEPPVFLDTLTVSGHPSRPPPTGC